MTEFPSALKYSLGHAYILEGEASQRLALGGAFAKKLNCLSDTGDDNCVSCRVFESGNHPDTFFVTGTNATSIGVDDVRDQIIMPMATKPFKYKYKIFIVDKAETLTPAAQNALLKTLEEPASYGVFLLLAKHTHSLLPTVLSRCVLVKLEDEPATPADPGHEALAKEITGCASGLDIIDALALYKRIEPLKESRESMSQFLDMLYLCYASQITQATKSGETPPQLWFASITAIQRTKQILAQNGNFQLAVELMLLNMSGHTHKHV